MFVPGQYKLHHLGCSSRANKGEDRAMVTSRLLGVFDGHRCASIAQFVSAHFPGILAQALAKEEAHAMGGEKKKKKEISGAEECAADRGIGLKRGDEHSRAVAISKGEAESMSMTGTSGGLHSDLGMTAENYSGPSPACKLFQQEASSPLKPLTDNRMNATPSREFKECGITSPCQGTPNSVSGNKRACVYTTPTFAPDTRMQSNLPPALSLDDNSIDEVSSLNVAQRALRRAFAMCHEKARTAVKGTAGTTAVVFWTCKVNPGGEASSSACSNSRIKSQTYGFCANAGDSRAVLSVNGRARRLSTDHTASMPAERDRIIRAGGKVEFGRLADEDGDGVLKVSRGIGNYDLEPSFICDPFLADPVLLSTEEYRAKRRISQVTDDGGDDGASAFDRVEIVNGDTEFLILASDGLWDVFQDQEAVEFVLEHLRAGDSAETCASRLTNAALERQSKDDTTVVLYVMDSSLIAVPTQYDPSAVSSMPPTLRHQSGLDGHTGQVDSSSRSRSIASTSIVSADGGIVFASSAGYVVQSEMISPPENGTTSAARAAVGLKNRKTPQRVGAWHGRPPKSKKHKKARRGFHQRQEHDIADDEFF